MAAADWVGGLPVIIQDDVDWVGGLPRVQTEEGTPVVSGTQAGLGLKQMCLMLDI